MARSGVRGAGGAGGGAGWAVAAGCGAAAGPGCAAAVAAPRPASAAPPPRRRRSPRLRAAAGGNRRRPAASPRAGRVGGCGTRFRPGARASGATPPPARPPGRAAGSAARRTAPPPPPPPRGMGAARAEPPPLRRSCVQLLAELQDLVLQGDALAALRLGQRRADRDRGRDEQRRRVERRGSGRQRRARVVAWRGSASDGAAPITRRAERSLVRRSAERIAVAALRRPSGVLFWRATSRRDARRVSADDGHRAAVLRPGVFR